MRKNTFLIVASFLIVFIVCMLLLTITTARASDNRADSAAQAIIINEGNGETKIQGNRGFPANEGQVFPPMPYNGTQGDRKVGPQYEALSDLVEFQHRFTVKEIDNMRVNAKNVQTEVVTPSGEFVNISHRSKNILLYLRNPKKVLNFTVEIRGWIMVRATKKDITSEELLAIAMHEAWKLGANSIYGRDGFTRTLLAKGWGIGGNSTIAKMGNNDTLAGVATGGTGYSSGESKFQDRPWIKVQALYVTK